MGWKLWLHLGGFSFVSDILWVGQIPLLTDSFFNLNWDNQCLNDKNKLLNFAALYGLIEQYSRNGELIKAIEKISFFSE